MALTLFRRDAIEHHRAKIWGEVTLSVPVSLTVMTGFLTACLVAVSFFVIYGSYARKQHAQGFLAPMLGVARVMPTRGGIITAIHATEGQLVEQGTPLLTVNVEQTGEHGGGVDSAILESLKQQRARLGDEIDLDRRQNQAEKQRLDGEIVGLVSELRSMEQEYKVQVERTTVAHDQLAAIIGLANRGIVSQYELKTRQDNHLSQQRAELAITRNFAGKKKELAQRRAEIEQLPLVAEKQVGQLESAIADIDVKIKQTDGQRAYLVTAPKTGRISGLQAWIGKTAEPNMPLMAIVPEGDALAAELFVPARAIGLIAPGQKVYLSYASFPYQQYGFGQGTVESISHTVLKPDQAIGPIAFDAPSYRVRVAITRQTINAYGKDIPLQADMQVSADILFDRRSIVIWIFSPLFSAWRP
jgi:membrane fusion protein